MANQNNPQWWKNEQTSTWDRVKDAMSRDWEQTKHDFGSKAAKDLNQDVGDTVKQAAGKEPVPAPNQKTPDSSRQVKARDWNDVEPAVRYGYGAAGHYKGETDWTDDVQAKMREEWNDLKTGKTWDEAKDYVRHGWDSARRPNKN